MSAINWRWTQRPTSEGFTNPFTYKVQPVVFNVDLTNPSCPVPGGVKCAGPVYLVTLNNANPSGGVTYQLNLPFTIECCVTGPYFAGAILPELFGAGAGAQILFDDGGFYWPGPVLGQVCRTYNNWGAGWADFNEPPPGLDFEINLLLWSEGYTPLDPATQCTPGLCDYQYWYGGARMDAAAAEFAYTIPNGTGSRSEMGVRFVSSGLDTLKSMSFMGYTFAGAPDIVVNVYSSGPYLGGTCWSTEPAGLLYSVTIPNASLVLPPLINDVPLPDITWGVLNGGLPQDIYVSISVAGGLPNRFALYTKTLQLAGCAPAGAEPHTVAMVSGTWLYMGDYFGDDDEVYIDANICAEKVPVVEANCSPGGPDQWPTWMHDYQRTGASTINLGDPCKVREVWSQNLPQLSNFTEPVVAGDIVYVSDETGLNAFSLISPTGAPVGNIHGAPYMIGANRGNVTVDDGKVFVTGGNAKSVSAWDPALTAPFWSNDLTAGVLTGASNGPLLKQNRFGVTVFLTVGLDKVLIVGTEDQGGGGLLYALDANTGYLYSGWGINPVALDRACIHGPAYDGTNLFVGTGGATSLADGSIYSIAAATGAINWNFKDAGFMNDGYPGGVSIDGSFLYAATRDGTAGTGRRYKIDKSGAGPVVAWQVNQGPSLFGAPTIGRNFVYIPQDNPSTGVLMVKKDIGTVAYNWSANGVFMVTQPVTLTCDKFVFAGDRNGTWWLLNATDQSVEWHRTFLGIVNGTALASGSDGADYAVVNARSSAVAPGGAGVVTAWKFNQANRPFTDQLVFETSILVPLNTLGGNPWTEPAVYGNQGCVPLNITGTNIIDLNPTASKNVTKLQRQYASAYSNIKVGGDYLSYFSDAKRSKADRMNGLSVSLIDGEYTSFDQKIEKADASYGTTKRASQSMAASANLTRTSAVTYGTNPVPAGGTTDISWLYDGTGLGRGGDDEYIESVSDDPDFYPEDPGGALLGYPALLVHYLGGCQLTDALLTWNTLGAANTEKVYNYGSMGFTNDAVFFGSDPSAVNTNLYDGGLVLAGDSSATIGGAQMRASYGTGFNRNYLPNPNSSAICGFDEASDIHLGWYRAPGSGCPGTPVEVFGSWVRSYYVDTNESELPGTPLATIGVNITQTEVGANDPLYGDFKLIRWEFQNRDAVAKSNLYAGTFMDWDVMGSYLDNSGRYRDDYNGYFIWDNVTPKFAYGMLDPNQPSTYTGVDPLANAPHRIEIVSNANRVYSPGAWSAGNGASVWHQVVTQLPTRGVDNGEATLEDRSALLVHQPFNLAPLGTAAVHEALYGISAASNDPAVIGAAGAALAKRSARWGGFARGDVNDDGVINLGDVCWLLSGNQIYPDAFSGDVNNSGGAPDAADQLYLLNYVSGGPAPLGAWRFGF